MLRTTTLGLLALLALATGGCPSTYTYPNDATGRYCRHRVVDCGEPLTGAECVNAINGTRNTIPACAAVFDAESECKALAACSESNPCSAEHEATNTCLANGGMGGGI